MKKAILILIATSCFLFGYSQKEEAVNYYKEGTKALEQKNYPEAISLLTSSIKENQNVNAYFNRAVAYYYLGDSCSFCEDLKNASLLGDEQASNLYREKCTYSTMSNLVPDSIKLKHPEVLGLKIVHNKCNIDSIILAIIEREPIIKTKELSEIMGVYLLGDKDPEVFTIVEEMPVFEGGDDARNRILAENIKYPKKAKDYGIQGTVYVSFIVEKNGAVSNVKILRGIGGGCDEEAINVVKLLNKWSPGRQNGKTVRVLFNIPISFTLSR